MPMKKALRNLIFWTSLSCTNVVFVVMHAYQGTTWGVVAQGVILTWCLWQARWYWLWIMEREQREEAIIAKMRDVLR